MFLEELNRRNVPEYMNVPREELKRLLLSEEYGFQPPACPVSAEVTKELPNFCAGKAVYSEINLTCTLPQGEFTFPVRVGVPKAGGKKPAVVYISFEAPVPNKYIPAEELIDRGIAFFEFGYKDIVPDDNTANTEGLSKLLYPEGRKPDDAGAISLWAWAASRVLDYALTRDYVDADRTAVAGHSRLGKTSLLAGALDERFKYVFSNGSGCSGIAIHRGKQGETVERIKTVFPYWFSENFLKYTGSGEDLPFDQDALLSLVAPRKLYVGNAVEDIWADPDSEYLACKSASRAWEKLGVNGLLGSDRKPQVGDVFNEGNIGYHLRKGTHYLSREDWNKFIDFVK